MDWSVTDIAIVLVLMSLAFVAGWKCRSWIFRIAVTMPLDLSESTEPCPEEAGSVYEGVVTYGAKEAMLRLYRIEEGKAFYWEANAAQGELWVKAGPVGEEAKEIYTTYPARKVAAEVVQAASREWRARGYAELPREKLAKLTIDCNREKFEQEDPAMELSDVITETLGPLALGHLDETAVEADRVRAFCHVVDARLASTFLIEALQFNRFLEGARMTTEREGKVTVHWPLNN